ncbi:MAG: 16S rRNA (cytosine(1402)-N(4))-methyltransferase RsmH [Bacteroidota bacterium]|nr:16S rRNA (cytosine(1402)-N(4))-methyltransferase RsmH [Candidatus Kapabacteria bacterium]MDW8272004.1 16S rRNA (cytosine(1402)-N(4))-methyltransferase RsmH [Bacteroidota bacterium]
MVEQQTHPMRGERIYHQPVMVQEVLELLLTDPDGLYIDGTIGGGGHAAAILERLRDGKLIGFDGDPDAIAACRGAFREELARGSRSRIELVLGSYLLACSREDIYRRLAGQVQGILLDLGVSSHQLDEPSRGFSYRYDAPLDLRFGGTSSDQPPASALLEQLSERELADLFYRYGEERASRRIARAIVEVRRSSPIRSTGQLRAIVERCVHPRQRIDALSRVFQALRIAVNRELEQLEEFLRCMPSLLRPGGRIVVISYHSLEDRIVKRTFRTLAREVQPPLLRILTPKPLRPQQEEIRRNPRSRSAKLRAGERIVV